MQKRESLKPKFHWHIMQKQDIKPVCALAARCHPDLPERAAVLAEKRRLAPESCFVLAGTDTKNISGYILAHPWTANSIAKLDSPLHILPPETDTLYLHDLALDKAARGRGLAGLGVQILCAYASAAGFAFLALVAVHNSAPFWQAQGFVIQNSIGKELAASLASYGSNARFMVKKLPVRTAEKQPAPLL